MASQEDGRIVEIGTYQELSHKHPKRRGCRQRQGRDVAGVCQWSPSHRVDTASDGRGTRFAIELSPGTIRCALARWRWLVRGALPCPLRSRWDREFESPLLQEGVHCELDRGERSLLWLWSLVDAARRSGIGGSSHGYGRFRCGSGHLRRRARPVLWRIAPYPRLVPRPVVWCRCRGGGAAHRETISDSVGQGARENPNYPTKRTGWPGASAAGLCHKGTLERQPPSPSAITAPVWGTRASCR